MKTSILSRCTEFQCKIDECKVQLRDKTLGDRAHQILRIRIENYVHQIQRQLNLLR